MSPKASLWSIGPGAAILSVLVWGCAPGPVREAPPAPACPAVETPACPAPTPPPPVVPPPVEARGKLVPASWPDLPAWGSERLAGSLEAFVRSCAVLERQDAWKGVCAGAQTFTAPLNERDVAAFFELNFDPWQVVNADDSTSGMITGYYEPLLHGSRTRSDRFRYPLYAVPKDLLVIDLSSVYPDLKHRRLRGRIEGNRVVPYLARGEIESGEPLKGNEIAWVDDAVDAFFLHIQGSGQVELDNGERIRVGYADQNGHPFRSLG
ncbi:MAG: MltA domain-containing protein, partial [Usitatibacter sp.]